MEYRPLNRDEIRLLVLLPRGRNDAIECRIIHSAISKKPNYEALSYEWGISEPAESIIMNRINRNITPNLWSALYHLRLQEKERVLWIDALCINQMDIIERNHQVQLMGQIYSDAQFVIVWLGPVTPTHDATIMSLFKWIDECAKEEKSTTTFLKYYYPALENVRPTTTMQYWKALGSQLCSSTYWQRTWIVQEVIMATHLKIQHGQWIANWDGITFLEWGLSLFPNNRLIRQVENSVVVKLQEQRRLRQLGFGGSLESLLELTKNSLRTDSRDAIYSLLNIAGDCTVVADYSKSLPEVYKTVLVAMRRSPETIVPFSQLLQECIGQRISFPLRILHKDADKVRRITTRIQPTFTVQCSIETFARCDYVGQPWNVNPSSQKGLTDMRSTIKCMTDLEVRKRLSQMAIEHKKWALPYKQGGGHSTNSKSLHPESKKQGFEENMPGSDKPAFDKGCLWAPEHIEALQNYSVFVTEWGVVGLAPLSAKTGDYICTFEGSKSIALVHNPQGPKPCTIRLPENGETYGMVVSMTRNPIFDVFPQGDRHMVGHKELVELDLASIQSLTQPGRPVNG